MHPIEQAVADYRIAGVRDFQHDLHGYMETGLVYVTPAEFLMAKPCNAEEIPLLSDPFYVPQGPLDTWFVWYAAGKGMLARFMEVAPFALPKVGLHRRGKSLRIHDWNRLWRKTHGISTR